VESIPEVKKQVLIIEDEPDLSAVFVNLLEVFGFTGLVANSAQQALNVLTHRQFDLFIIDLTLPDRPGVDLYKEIIIIHPEYRGRVIFTSGFNVSDELNQIMKRDGASFLAKPFSMDKLKKVLDRWM
jgi:DNA-binding NtrC family response regulator